MKLKLHCKNNNSKYKSAESFVIIDMITTTLLLLLKFLLKFLFTLNNKISCKKKQTK